MIHSVLLVSRQGKVRLNRFYTTTNMKERKRMTMEVTNEVLQRKPRMCNFVEWRGLKLIYKRFASLFFCMVVDVDDNELIVLEMIQRWVECLDLYFGSVCELDIIFNFNKAYMILDEFVLGGHLQEANKRLVAGIVHKQDELVEELRLQEPGLASGWSA